MTRWWRPPMATRCTSAPTSRCAREPRAGSSSSPISSTATRRSTKATSSRSKRMPLGAAPFHRAHGVPPRLARAQSRARRTLVEAGSRGRAGKPRLRRHRDHLEPHRTRRIGRRVPPEQVAAPGRLRRVERGGSELDALAASVDATLAEWCGSDAAVGIDRDGDASRIAAPGSANCPAAPPASPAEARTRFARRTRPAARVVRTRRRRRDTPAVHGDSRGLPSLTRPAGGVLRRVYDYDVAIHIEKVDLPGIGFGTTSSPNAGVASVSSRIATASATSASSTSTIPTRAAIPSR